VNLVRANISLQRTTPCGLAAELGSFGTRITRCGQVSAVIFLLAVATAVGASPTPWEAYLNDPTPKNAASVSEVSYSAGTLDSNPVSEDLDLLEAEVLSGDRYAVRLAFRLLKHSDGHAGEALCITLGRLIRANPRLFLEELKVAGSQDRLDALVGNFGVGFVDRPHALSQERRKRIEALKTITSPTLSKVRDACILELSKSP
jgi:hypothetical protein